LRLRLSNIANGKVLTKIAEGSEEDVDIAVKAAQKAFDTTWGLNTPGHQRGVILNKVADLMEAHADELAAIEALDNGASSLTSHLEHRL
jgi:aldehyde dehydrogenase (NAD+)